MSAVLRRGWLPGILLALCMAQLCERFSFYGLKGFLMPCLQATQDLTSTQAIHWYGLILALVFLTPALAGFVLDRWSLHRAALLGGASLAILGYGLASVPGLLIAGLACIILGSGSFCAGLPTAIDRQSKKLEYDLNRALTIGYMFTNVGVLLSPYVCGTLAVKQSFSAGFLAAAGGMCLSLLFLCVGTRGLDTGKDAPQVSRAPRQRGLLTTRERRRILAVLLINAFATIYWIGAEQSGGTLTDFAKNGTDLKIGGFEMPYTWFGSINPSVVLVVTPMFLWLWKRGRNAGVRLSAANLQAIALFLMGASFFLMIGAERFTEGGTKLVSPFWLTGVYVLQTLGEFFVGPIGLALTIRLAPARCKALMVGVWWASGTISAYGSGALTGALAWVATFGIKVDLWWFLAVGITLAGALAVLVSPRLTAMVLRRR